MLSENPRYRRPDRATLYTEGFQPLLVVEPTAQQWDELERTSQLCIPVPAMPPIAGPISVDDAPHLGPCFMITLKAELMQRKDECAVILLLRPDPPGLHLREALLRHQYPINHNADEIREQEQLLLGFLSVLRPFRPRTFAEYYAIHSANTTKPTSGAMTERRQQAFGEAEEQARIVEYMNTLSAVIR